MNLVGTVNDAADYFVSPSTDLNSADFYPISENNDIILDIDKFNKDFDYDKDYNAMPQSGNYYGAYSGFGENPGKGLSVSIKELPDITSVSEIINIIKGLFVRPNPCITSFAVDIPKHIFGTKTLCLTDQSGRKAITNSHIKSTSEFGNNRNKRVKFGIRSIYS